MRQWFHSSMWRVRKKGQNKMKSSPQMEKETAIDRRAHTRTFPGWTHTYTHDKDLKRRFTQRGKKDQFTLISLPGNTQHSTAQLGMQQTRAVAEVKRWACFFSPLQLYSVCICTVNCDQNICRDMADLGSCTSGLLMHAWGLDPWWTRKIRLPCPSHGRT